MGICISDLMLHNIENTHVRLHAQNQDEILPYSSYFNWKK